MPTFTAEQLKRVGIAIFEAAGTPSDEARQTVELLVKSNLCGHDSHGVRRIPEYIDKILNGLCKPRSEIKVVRESATTALVDGCWGLGQVVAMKTMKLAIGKAEKYDVGMVSTFNCCHMGRMADYALMAVPHDMIGICLAIGHGRMAPYGGVEPILNTSPVGIAIPAGKEPPFVLDISMAVCAAGKVMHALEKGENLPEGYIIDKEGKPTTNPEDYLKGGAILPFGGPVAYKGYGLAMVVDILAGILSGRGSAFDPTRREQGIFQMAIKIEAFQPVDEFKANVDRLIRRIKKSKRAAGFEEILIPGEIELRNEKKNLERGIEVPEKTWNGILQTAKRLNVDVESLLSNRSTKT
ncbi:Ldh family oxidoreductase [candidate division Kazan bacterium]|uniref:Ldh family oxidoreductase n=1 Tax=candidate division Kazan bacterium TaxID=2202143 RepID=A0A420ZAV3_UNCK3|nr:MAG: Ldh family oxidoreductase [candidate division Kazan bacterium]